MKALNFIVDVVVATVVTLLVLVVVIGGFFGLLFGSTWLLISMGLESVELAGLLGTIITLSVIGGIAYAVDEASR